MLWNCDPTCKYVSFENILRNTIQYDWYQRRWDVAEKGLLRKNTIVYGFKVVVKLLFGRRGKGKSYFL